MPARDGDGQAVRFGNAPSPDHAGPRSAISSTWQRPAARHPGRSMPSHRRQILPSLRPGCRVVTLREVGEMARTRTNHPPDLPHDPTISETCPPGEGALPCSWDGPLDCQARTVVALTTSRQGVHAGRASARVRADPCPVGVVVTQLVTHRGREDHHVAPGRPALLPTHRGSRGVPVALASPDRAAARAALDVSQP